jgi:hypothetical protein
VLKPVKYPYYNEWHQSLLNSMIEDGYEQHTIEGFKNTETPDDSIDFLIDIEYRGYRRRY